MKTAFGMCVALTLAAYASAPKNDPAMQKLLPQKLEFTGGSDYGSRSAHWEDGRIVYIDDGAGFLWLWRYKRTRIIHPSAAAWREFWNEMDAVDIWKWRKDYWHLMIGGFMWNIKLSHTGRAVDSQGFNAYPAETNPRKQWSKGLETTKRFDRFYDAVMKLVGEKNG